ncbi:hypothetical protein FRAAL1600 [Frankia alni ACN14a]|uniref:Uncharacterized protein n=1 Tax=Frankia alni (strain DSM 45986 / CECT 9034 / ACN14a) TaxID=326424 RepID=Q0RQC1_FRAAA|nr:hypothetical protein FRAAL1600 [Frankia alni ACN14a]
MTVGGAVQVADHPWRDRNFGYLHGAPPPAHVADHPWRDRNLGSWLIPGMMASPVADHPWRDRNGISVWT